MIRLTVLVRAACVAAALFCNTSVASAGTLTTLYAFTGGTDGGPPTGPLHLDSRGRLYGVTFNGGTGKNGAAFQLAPGGAGAPWTETVLYNFPRNGKSFAGLNGVLLADPAGALYGTALGDAFGQGEGFVYRLAPPSGTGAWRFSKIFTFAGPESPLGGGPVGGLALDSFGDLVGVAANGGDQSGRNPCRCGVAFSLTPPLDGGAWQENVLHTFGPRPDGTFPSGPLTVDSAGTLYGVTQTGGTGRCLDGSGVIVIGCGTVFSLTPSATGWTETIIHDFPDYAQPSNVAIGPDGALYGTDLLDVYRLARARDGSWHKTVLHTFPGGVAGSAPASSVIFDAKGNLYGTTYAFGIDGQGTVYELSPPAAAGQSWTETTLAIVTPAFGEGDPIGPLVRGPDGTLYGAAGAASGGGGPQNGFIYAVTP